MSKVPGSQKSRFKSFEAGALRSGLVRAGVNLVGLAVKEGEWMSVTLTE